MFTNTYSWITFCNELSLSSSVLVPTQEKAETQQQSRANTLFDALQGRSGPESRQTKAPNFLVGSLSVASHLGGSSGTGAGLFDVQVRLHSLSRWACPFPTLSCDVGRCNRARGVWLERHLPPFVVSTWDLGRVWGASSLNLTWGASSSNLIFHFPSAHVYLSTKELHMGNSYLWLLCPFKFSL